jgi:DNA mismatch repair protein MutS2
MSAINPDQLTYENLGFNDVREWLINEASGDAVREQFSQLTPIQDPDELEGRFSRLSEIMSLMESNPGFQIYPYEDLHETLKILRLAGSTLYPEKLTALRTILEQTRLLKKMYAGKDLDTASLWEGEFEQIQDLNHLEDDILRIIGPDNEVLDKASTTLASLRGKLRKSGSAVRSRMNDLVKKYGQQGYLNEGQAGIKGGRLVLPVLSSYKHQVQGVIQDMSNTGTTTFIEPFEIIELNNQIKTMENDEQQEVRRILKELTAKLHLQHDAIRSNYAILLILDEYISLAKFAKTFACCLPKLSRDGEYKLIAARNPRLALQRKVVPLDLHMPADISTLIVTGPNAGGKTVALKTIGLLALMANSGIPIPAGEGSVVPVFDTIFTDIGDQQSLVNDLSTFSAHIGGIIRILEQASAQSLVLLDELGTGTDPAEGGALARAILMSLAERGVKTIATTHLGDLKVFAHETEHVMNGAMEFDQDGLMPTYRFQSGVPGSSYGFEISRRLGLSVDILDQAKSFLGVGRSSMEKLLRALETERVNLSGLTSENEMLQRDLKLKQRKMDTALETVQKAERKADRDAAKKAGSIIADARRTVENVIREIRESQAAKESIKQVRSELDQLETRLDEVAEQSDIKPKLKKLSAEEASVGKRVIVLSLDQIGVILEEPLKGKVHVEVDGKRLRVPLDWLSEAPEAKQASEARPVVNIVKSTASTYSLDLRGYRADAAISELGLFIDHALLSNMSLLQIIHGKGTGVIKKVVHEVLDQHPAVKSKRLGGHDEGGAGVTFVELK